MQVTVVDPSAYTPPYDHALCAALVRQGLKVELATSHFLYGPTPQANGYKVNERFYRHSSNRYRERPVARGRMLQKLVEHPRDMSRFVQDISSDGPDIVHFQWLTVQPIDPHFIKQITQPTVLTAHDIVPREPRTGQIKSLRRLYHCFDAIVAHSKHGRGRLISELGVEEDKVHVIPHGVFDYLTKLPEERPIDPAAGELEGRKVVLFFGLLRPYKGIEVLIDAFSQAPSDAVLLIVGMPRMPIGPLHERAKKHGMADRVRFIPRFITDPEIPAYFRRADLVVLPYLQIDQSGVLNTTLAFHKPMIVSDVGGFSEFAREHAAAMLVPPGNDAHLGAAITRLLQDPGARKRLALESERAATGPFSWDAIAEQTRRLYEQLVTQSSNDGNRNP